MKKINELLAVLKKDSEAWYDVELIRSLSSVIEKLTDLAIEQEKTKQMELMKKEFEPTGVPPGERG